MIIEQGSVPELWRIKQGTSGRTVIQMGVGDVSGVLRGCQRWHIGTPTYHFVDALTSLAMATRGRPLLIRRLRRQD